MKIGSLFDGSGGFPLAASMCGITPVWASEVEPYPIAVTKSRFPNMKHLGSVTDINGGEIEPIDVITFGSPCQDLSVAGKRAGLKHEVNGDDETTRSGLFMEAVRIIKEMREATNGVYPRIAVWENVPGAFSSSRGEDFRIVLQELIRIADPETVMPEVPEAGWAHADSYCGDEWSLAYRVLDAQFWGVPQRRRRIYLVLDLGGQCAGEILFKRKCLRGHFAEGRTPWQRIACDAERGSGAANFKNSIIAIDQQGGKGGANYAIDVMPTICSDSHGTPHAVVYQSPECVGVLASSCKNAEVTDGTISPCLMARAGVTHAVANHPADSRVDIDDSGKVQTLTSRMSTGGGNLPMVMEPIPIHDQATRYRIPGNHINSNAVVRTQYIVRRLTPTECARLQGFPDLWGHLDKKTEFPDAEYIFWLNVRNTHAEINGRATKEYTRAQMLNWYNKLHTDSAEYKMWGNGIALPNALYVMQGIAEMERQVAV